MKTKITLSILTAILTLSLIMTGCSNDSEPNFGEHGAKIYEPSLSAMSDEAIRIKIDELYDYMMRTRIAEKITAYSSKIEVYQNELIIRQLEAMNSDIQEPVTLTITDGGYWTKGVLRITVDDPDDKQGLDGLGYKRGLKGVEKNTLKGN